MINKTDKILLSIGFIVIVVSYLNVKGIWMKLHEIELKVGDKVWSISHGWGIIKNAKKDSISIKYDDVSYKHYNTSLSTQHLFWNEFEVPKEAFIKPLPKLAVDTKVIVWNHRDKFKGHFKEFNNRGEIVCFDNGQTSFTTTTTNVETWDNWEVYKEEEK